MLMLLIETNVRKTYVIATQDVFRGLFSLTENGPKWGPNCADDVSVRGARAPRTEASSAQLGTHFGLIGTRTVKSPEQAALPPWSRAEPVSRALAL